MVRHKSAADSIEEIVHGLWRRCLTKMTNRIIVFPKSNDVETADRDGDPDMSEFQPRECSEEEG